MIGVAFISDRGNLYLPRTLAACDNLLTGVDAVTIIDDHEHKLGMAGAVRAAWDWALETGCDYLLHWEEDFLPLAPVPLAEMIWALARAPYLAQVVLKRGPWSPAEHQAGGIIEMRPDAYMEVDLGADTTVMVHDQVGDCGFSLNPCLIPRAVLEIGWPDGNEAEATQIFAGKGYRFAFYGGRHDPPLVEHVGVVRGAGWRL